MSIPPKPDSPSQTSTRLAPFRLHGRHNILLRQAMPCGRGKGRQLAPGDEAVGRMTVQQGEETLQARQRQGILGGLMDGWMGKTQQGLIRYDMVKKTRTMGWGWVGFFRSPLSVGATFFRDAKKLLFQSMLCFALQQKGGFFWACGPERVVFLNNLKNFTSAPKKTMWKPKKECWGEVSSIVDFRCFFC